MENQINMRLVSTDSGQLLIRKCMSDDDEIAVKYSMIHDTGDYYVELSCTMSFKTDADQEKAFSTEKLSDLAAGLKKSMEEYI